MQFENTISYSLGSPDKPLCLSDDFFLYHISNFLMYLNSATLLSIKLFKYLSNKKTLALASGRAERPRILSCRRIHLS